MSEGNDAAQPDDSETTDGATLGEKVGDVNRPGTVGFPPATPYGVGPHGSSQDADHIDSVRERSEREEPEHSPDQPDAIRLTATPAGSATDLESELSAMEVPATGLVSPEEAAMGHENDE